MQDKSSQQQWESKEQEQEREEAGFPGAASSEPERGVFSSMKGMFGQAMSHVKERIAVEVYGEKRPGGSLGSGNHGLGLNLQQSRPSFSSSSQRVMSQEAAAEIR